MSFSVGQVISTVPHIEAADMANKSQLSDAIAYLRKAQRYHNGSVYSSIQNSLLPYACNLMNPPMTREELKNDKLAVKISQWIYRLILKQCVKSHFISTREDNPDIIERALSLWWAFSGRDEKKNIKEQIASIGADIRTQANTNYVDFKTGGYTEKEKYINLLTSKKK